MNGSTNAKQSHGANEEKSGHYYDDHQSSASDDDSNAVEVFPTTILSANQLDPF